MRQIKALIYSLLGGMVAWGYWERREPGLAVAVLLFTLVVIALTLSPIGRLRITWGKNGITLSTFPRNPRHIAWNELETISLDHLGYHITARTGRFRIRKEAMPPDLLERIRTELKTRDRRTPVGSGTADKPKGGTEKGIGEETGEETGDSTEAPTR